MDHSRLSMPLGEAIFTQRSIRRFRPDPIPLADIRLIVEAAVQGTQRRQPTARAVSRGERSRARSASSARCTARRGGRSAATRDSSSRKTCHRASIPRPDWPTRWARCPASCSRLAVHNGPPDSVIPAVQNLMLAARAIGIGSVPTTLHPSVMARFHEMFDIPDDVGFHFCVPLGYPQGNFGPNVRKPTSETTFLNRWGAAVPWN